uniref:Nudix hydrolase domain-containing protein n=1 Tax=viral metagenome TaxID=1070528 RepID=A0A6M3LCS5_9ZZZZ
MKEYVVGFAFNNNCSEVLLIHKIKPEWQRGRVNGIGGKLEKDEHFYDCMVREFKEETGVGTDSSDWTHYCTLSGEDFKVYFFYIIGGIEDASSIEDEKIEWFNIYKLPYNIISNLMWLIPLALDCDLQKSHDEKLFLIGKYS